MQTIRNIKLVTTTRTIGKSVRPTDRARNSSAVAGGRRVHEHLRIKVGGTHGSDCNEEEN